MMFDRLGLTLLALGLIAVGNLWHFVWAVNISSALGHSEKEVSRMRLVIVALFIVSSGMMAWYAYDRPVQNWPLLAQAYAVLCLVSGLIIGPVGSLAIRFRRPAVGSPRESVHHDLAQIHGAHTLVGESWKGRLLHLPWNESLHLRRVEWDLDFPDLPPALNGLSIVHLTDLHFARCYRREFFEAVVAACLDWQADLILLTGDIVDEPETIAWIAPVLGSLNARLGKFAILGNHDYEHDTDAILGALEQAGFTTMEGKWKCLDVDGISLGVGGTSAPWGPIFDTSDIPEADFHILLSHTPDQFNNAQNWGMNFVLAGHNHGGQIRLPLVGPVFMPSKYSRRYDRGFFRRDSTLMYVSEGVAGKHPLRFGCKPEIARFVLQHAGVAPSFHEHETAGATRIG